MIPAFVVLSMSFSLHSTSVDHTSKHHSRRVIFIRNTVIVCGTIAGLALIYHLMRSQKTTSAPTAQQPLPTPQPPITPKRQPTPQTSTELASLEEQALRQQFKQMAMTIHAPTGFGDTQFFVETPDFEAQRQFFENEYIRLRQRYGTIPELQASFLDKARTCLTTNGTHIVFSMHDLAYHDGHRWRQKDKSAVNIEEIARTNTAQFAGQAKQECEKLIADVEQEIQAHVPTNGNDAH
jgi:hypothetical protein